MRGEGELEDLEGWMDDLRDWTNHVRGGGIGVTNGDLKRSAENREHWRTQVRRTKILRA